MKGKFMIRNSRKSCWWEIAVDTVWTKRNYLVEIVIGTSERRWSISMETLENFQRHRWSYGDNEKRIIFQQTGKKMNGLVKKKRMVP